MNNILYEERDGLYVNMTNKCPCACTFCVRNTSNAVGNVDTLWLEKEPTVQEIIDEFNKRDLSKYREVVFCGFGEPTQRLVEMLEVCKYIRSISSISIRLNTNGLANLIHGKPTEEMFAGAFDVISISLNSPSKEEYLAVTRPKFGEDSFEAMLMFAKHVKQYVPDVAFSVVDVIGKDAIDKSYELSKKLEVPLRVRKYSSYE